jgi:hypothetical protein
MRHRHICRHYLSFATVSALEKTWDSFGTQGTYVIISLSFHSNLLSLRRKVYISTKTANAVLSLLLKSKRNLTKHYR